MAPINGAVEIPALQTLRERLFYHSHHPVMASHSGFCRMYSSIQREFFWPHMENNLYTTLGNYSTCARNGTSAKLKRELQLILASRSLEFIGIDILPSLRSTVNGNQSVIVMTNRCLKLTRAMPTGKTSSSNLASLFIDSWIIAYGIPRYVQTDNGVQFLSKSFSSLFITLDVQHLTTTDYYLHTKWLVKR